MLGSTGYCSLCFCLSCFVSSSCLVSRKNGLPPPVLQELRTGREERGWFGLENKDTPNRSRPDVAMASASEEMSL